MLRKIGVFLALLMVLVPSGAAAAPQRGRPNDALLNLMKSINADLAAQRASYRANEVDAFVIPPARAIQGRILQLPLRWVPNDSRRLADGTNLTYVVDSSDGATASGLAASDTEGAIDGAMTTWDTEARCDKLPIVKETDGGGNYDVLDSGDLPSPDLGANPFFADIVHAGWLPKGYFDALVPGGGDSILAVTWLFIFTDGAGNPTDINNDQYLDTALAEIYYNDNFGDPAGTRSGSPWEINQPLPDIDVETVALHESGHGLNLGHFRPPPPAVMNPVYAGIRQDLFPTDDAGNCTLYGLWPNP